MDGRLWICGVAVGLQCLVLPGISSTPSPSPGQFSSSALDHTSSSWGFSLSTPPTRRRESSALPCRRTLLALTLTPIGLPLQT